MPKLTSMKESKVKHILVYGPPKAGKTKLAGALAEAKKVIWFDFERGHGTLFQLPPEWQERIEVLIIPDHRHMPMAIETALKVIKGEPVEICEEHGKVGCPICNKDANKIKTRVCLRELEPDTVVVFDSLTQLTNSAIANITRSKPDDYKMEWDDWGNLGKVMDTFLGYVQAAPYNVVCISHENMVELVDGKKKIVPVAGTSNFSRNTAKYFDEVVYAFVENKKHKFASTTTFSNQIQTGGRSSFSLESAAEPKLLDLFA